MNVNHGLGQAIGNTGLGQAGGINTSGYIQTDYKHPCPSCGHCPTCGHWGWVAPRPYYGYPYYGYPYFYTYNGDPAKPGTGGTLNGQWSNTISAR